MADPLRMRTAKKRAGPADRALTGTGSRGDGYACGTLPWRWRWVRSAVLVVALRTAVAHVVATGGQGAGGGSVLRHRGLL